MPTDIGQGLSQAGQNILRAALSYRMRQDRLDDRGTQRLNTLQNQAGPLINTSDILPGGTSSPQVSQIGNAPPNSITSQGNISEEFDPSGVSEQFDPGTFDARSALQAKQQIQQRRSKVGSSMRQAKSMFGEIFKSQARIPKMESDLRFAAQEAKLMQQMYKENIERSKVDPNVPPPSDAMVRMINAKVNRVAQMQQELKQSKGRVQELYGTLTRDFGIDPANMDEHSLSQMGLRMDPELLQSIGISHPADDQGNQLVFPAFAEERGLPQSSTLSPAQALANRGRGAIR